MGNAASVDSMKTYEEDVSHLGAEEQLDKAQIDALFGSSISNLRLFDLLKDEGTGKVYPSDLRDMIRARRRVAENRRSASIVNNQGIGGKEKTNLVQTLANSESTLNRISQERAQFQQTICEATSSGRPVSEAIVKQNAAKLEEFAKMEQEVKKEHREAQQTLHSLRREEVAKAAKERAARMEKINSQMKDKTAFAFINEKGGGGGGGGSSNLRSGIIMFSPGNTQTGEPAHLDTLKRRTVTMAREVDDETN